jgi:hypothetical protein
MIELREKFRLEWKKLKLINDQLEIENKNLKARIDEINSSLSDFRSDTIYALDRCGEKLRTIFYKRP